MWPSYFRNVHTTSNKLKNLSFSSLVQNQKVKTVPVPSEVYRVLRSLANSAIPTTYNIVPEVDCIGKIDVYDNDELMWWVCRRDDRIEILHPSGEVVAVVEGDKLYVVLTGAGAGPFDVLVRDDGKTPEPVSVGAILVKAKRVLYWLDVVKA